jgi:hypothetical protein
MCPVCMAAVVLVVAGAASIAGPGALMVKKLLGCEQSLDESVKSSLVAAFFLGQHHKGEST